MFVIDGGGRLSRRKRRPWDWERLEFEGYVFIPENRRWDAVERDAVSKATGLYDLSAEYGVGAVDTWWKAFATACASRRLSAVGAIMEIGEPDLPRWSGKA